MGAHAGGRFGPAASPIAGGCRGGGHGDHGHFGSGFRSRKAWSGVDPWQSTNKGKDSHWPSSNGGGWTRPSWSKGGVQSSKRYQAGRKNNMTDCGLAGNAAGACHVCPAGSPEKSHCQHVGDANNNRKEAIGVKSEDVKSEQAVN